MQKKGPHRQTSAKRITSPTASRSLYMNVVVPCSVYPADTGWIYTPGLVFEAVFEAVFKYVAITHGSFRNVLQPSYITLLE